MKKSILMFLFVSLFFSNAEATPIEWSVESGGNGHYYEFIDNKGHIHWESAKQQAENMSFRGVSGHLATITSDAENIFVSSSSVWNDYTVSVWLGAEYNTEWTWITGEEWDYTNWHITQPNNLVSGNDFLLYYEDYQDKSLWADVYSTHYMMTGFIVEYEMSSAPVPEPGTMVLFGMGCLGFARVLRKKQ